MLCFFPCLFQSLHLFCFSSFEACHLWMSEPFHFALINSGWVWHQWTGFTTCGGCNGLCTFVNQPTLFLPNFCCFLMLPISFSAKSICCFPICIISFALEINCMLFSVITQVSSSVPSSISCFPIWCSCLHISCSFWSLTSFSLI